jgi:hypothetical protein
MVQALALVTPVVLVLVVTQSDDRTKSLVALIKACRERRGPRPPAGAARSRPSRTQEYLANEAARRLSPAPASNPYELVTTTQAG